MTFVLGRYLTFPFLARVGVFFSWWQKSLLAWLPTRWRNALGWSEDRLLLSLEGDQLRVQYDSGGQLRTLTPIPVSAGAERFDSGSLGHMATLPRCWTLPAVSGLRRRLKVPASAEKHLRQVIGYEIDRQTPFEVDAVYYDVRLIARQGDQLDVELAVLPRKALDALWPGQSVSSLELVGLDLVGQDEQPMGFNLLPEQDRRQRVDPMRYWNQALALFAVLATVAAAGQVLENRRAVATELQARVDSQVVQARQVSAQHSQLSRLVEGAVFLRSQRADRPAVVEVWNEVTRRLPEGTWLEKLAIEGDQLQLMGYSTNAPSLVSRMEGSPLWHKPALTGSLQSDTASGSNRFTLTAQLANGVDSKAGGAHGN